MDKSPKLKQKVQIVDWDCKILSGEIQEVIGKDRIWVNAKDGKKDVCDCWPLHRIFDNLKDAKAFCRLELTNKIAENERLMEGWKKEIDKFRKMLGKLK